MLNDCEKMFKILGKHPALFAELPATIDAFRCALDDDYPDICDAQFVRIMDKIPELELDEDVVSDFVDLAPIVGVWMEV